MAILDQLNTWNYKTRHVQKATATDDFSGGDFLRGASVLFSVGTRRCPTELITTADPNNIAPAKGNIYPVGLLQTGSISQQKQLEEIFEIGSERRYFVPGRTFFQLQAQRIMINLASLLRALYQNPYAGTEPDAAIPGFTDHYTNLAAKFFNTPTGILLIDCDANDRVVGGSYLEDCYIQSYNRQIAAAQTVIAEQCLIRFDAIVPVSKAKIIALTPAFNPVKPAGP